MKSDTLEIIEKIAKLSPQLQPAIYLQTPFLVFTDEETGQQYKIRLASDHNFRYDKMDLNECIANYAAYAANYRELCDITERIKKDKEENKKKEVELIKEFFAHHQNEQVRLVDVINYLSSVDENLGQKNIALLISNIYRQDKHMHTVKVGKVRYYNYITK